jgi:3-hydroxyacyl-CoA dehydrogenase
MDADEKEICDFLRSWPGQFVSHREICKRAGGKWRYREDPKWAVPILTRMVEKGILESDAGGHFRLLPEKKEKKQQISPELQKLLDAAKDKVTEIEDSTEPEQ